MKIELVAALGKGEPYWSLPDLGMNLLRDSLRPTDMLGACTTGIFPANFVCDLDILEE